MHSFVPVLFLAAVTVGEVLGSHKFNGPTAVPVVLHNGYLADTHEVAAAKNAHLATLSHQSHGGSYGHHGVNQGGLSYHGYAAVPQVQHDGHIAIPHVLHDGHLADTHEVAAAKAEHYAAVAKARAHGGYAHGGAYNGQYDHYSGASGAHQGYGTHGSYHGPLAKPLVLPNGYLADTVEVANAKQQHFQLVHSSHSNYHY